MKVRLEVYADAQSAHHHSYEWSDAREPQVRGLLDSAGRRLGQTDVEKARDAERTHTVLLEVKLTGTESQMLDHADALVEAVGRYRQVTAVTVTSKDVED